MDGVGGAANLTVQRGEIFGFGHSARRNRSAELCGTLARAETTRSAIPRFESCAAPLTPTGFACNTWQPWTVLIATFRSAVFLVDVLLLERYPAAGTDASAAFTASVNRALKRAEFPVWMSVVVKMATAGWAGLQGGHSILVNANSWNGWQRGGTSTTFRPVSLAATWNYSS